MEKYYPQEQLYTFNTTIQQLLWAKKMADFEQLEVQEILWRVRYEIEVQEIDLDDEDFSCEVNSDDDDATKAVEQEVK